MTSIKIEFHPDTDSIAVKVSENLSRSQTAKLLLRAAFSILEQEDKGQNRVQLAAPIVPQLQ